jgi:glycosyltransferase involved in cell wall biosynthesis
MVQALAPLGFDLHLISDEHPAYAEFLDSLGGRRHRAPFCSDPADAAAKLNAVIQELQPALIHVNGHQGWLAPALLRSNAFPRARRRLFTMHLPVSSVEVLESRSFKRFIPGTWSARTASSDKAFLRLFDRVLSVSKRFGLVLVNGRFLRVDQLVCIPNAVDINRFQPLARPLNGPFIVGGAGNLIEQKRFDLLITAFAELKRTHPDACLRIAGEGEDQPSLLNLAKRLGVADSVSFAGFQRDMAAFYNSLDIFVLSSAHEAAPYVALEAAACGKPLVLTDVGDIRHVFHDGVDAWIVPPNDPAALADRTSALAGDPDKRAGFSSAARRLIVEEYSEKIWSERMRAFFSTEMAAALLAQPQT